MKYGKDRARCVVAGSWIAGIHYLVNGVKYGDIGC
jgi:hypothetical protein